VGNTLSICTLEVPTPERLDLGLFSSTAQVSGFWSINSMLLELHCIFEAPLDVLKFEF